MSTYHQAINIDPDVPSVHMPYIDLLFSLPYIEQLDIIYSLSAIFHYMFSGPLHLSRTSSVLLGLKRARNGVPCNEEETFITEREIVELVPTGS